MKIWVHSVQLLAQWDQISNRYHKWMSDIVHSLYYRILYMQVNMVCMLRLQEQHHQVDIARHISCNSESFTCILVVRSCYAMPFRIYLYAMNIDDLDLHCALILRLSPWYLPERIENNATSQVSWYTATPHSVWKFGISKETMYGFAEMEVALGLSRGRVTRLGGNGMGILR